MEVANTPITGVVVVQLEAAADARGSFTRIWNGGNFASAGIELEASSCSVSSNVAALTLRGLHLQVSPNTEVKLVTCLRGMVFDVAVDLRPQSPSYMGWYGCELSESNRRALLIPEGLAHGFLTLEDETDVLYVMSGSYAPASARGVRWDDAAFGIDWPKQPEVINDRDRNYPDYDPTSPWRSV